MEGLDSVFLSDQTTHRPVRSVSLPSRIHPLSVKLRETLIRLSIWQRTPSSISVFPSFRFETLLVGLVNLAELYGCVHELLVSPYVKHTLLHHQKGKLLEDFLDGSVVLLDVCEAAREVIIAVREHVTNLKSALRRKGGVDMEAKAYVNLRKKVKKEISKHIIALQKIKTRDISTNINQDPAIASTSVVREAIEISVLIFRHLLLFLSTIPPSPARKIKNNIGHFLIPFASSSLSDKYLDLIKEMKSVDDIFLGSNVDSGRTFGKANTMQKEKKISRDVVEENFCDLETELDSVFKSLVKTRVMFLNIFSNC